MMPIIKTHLCAGADEAALRFDKNLTRCGLGHVEGFDFTLVFGGENQSLCLHDGILTCNKVELNNLNISYFIRVYQVYDPSRLSQWFPGGLKMFEIFTTIIMMYDIYSLPGLLSGHRPWNLNK
jgi:hypothetical protein